MFDEKNCFNALRCFLLILLYSWTTTADSTVLLTQMSRWSPTHRYLTVGLHRYPTQTLNINRFWRFLEFSFCLLHLPAVFIVRSSARIIAGGGPDCNPPTCTVQAAPLSVWCGGSAGSAAIRAAGRESGGRYVRVVGIKKKRRGGKNSARRKKNLSILMGERGRWSLSSIFYHLLLLVHFSFYQDVVLPFCAHDQFCFCLEKIMKKTLQLLMNKL